MSLYIVNKCNDLYKQGTVIECLDHGCQVVETKTVNNRMEVVRSVGVAFPLAVIEPIAIKILHRGLANER